jgi:hypothetical protein
MCAFFSVQTQGPGAAYLQAHHRVSYDAEIFTKNVISALFNWHVPFYAKISEYVQGHDGTLSGEAIR